MFGGPLKILVGPSQQIGYARPRQIFRSHAQALGGASQTLGLFLR
jgi:hypothetical protein